MNINWMQFTPGLSLAGGLMIGTAVALFLLLNGRIAGISGIVGGLLKKNDANTGWRLSFVAGLIVSPLFYGLFAHPVIGGSPAGLPMLILAGVLVGIGTRYGAGCTSGHGICGLARFSPRSLVATATFMLAGFLTIYTVRHFF
ncbi:YeeE/YedE family protein [uncultured Oxalicibacterium sp.]|uniref:YeeE/YedE family protein n=1 Tax=uncultured Oxalicibacterium sp. TaxID=1168540 RepID=UPI0025FFA0EB|nr:YeeE/YedE family protein [uncultured Oxalicibacterium sp.]